MNLLGGCHDVRWSAQASEKGLEVLLEGLETADEVVADEVEVELARLDTPVIVVAPAPFLKESDEIAEGDDAHAPAVPHRVAESLADFFLGREVPGISIWVGDLGLVRGEQLVVGIAHEAEAAPVRQGQHVDDLVRAEVAQVENLRIIPQLLVAVGDALKLAQGDGCGHTGDLGDDIPQVGRS